MDFKKKINATEANNLCRSKLNYQIVMTRDLNTFLEDTIKMCIKDLVVYDNYYIYHIF
jgi:hypothetical protein